MPVNDFLVFGTDVGANVMPQADYAAAAFRQSGFEPGIAQSAQLNKVWRQSSFVAAALAKFIVNETGNNVPDDGALDTFITSLVAAIQFAAGAQPARIVSLSTPLNITAADAFIGLNRIVAPASVAAQLPSNAQIGQSFYIEDLANNMGQFGVTVNAPVGHTIAGLGAFVMNVDRQSCKFTYYGTNLWSVK